MDTMICYNLFKQLFKITYMNNISQGQSQRQSQSHGFIWENSIKTIFNLPSEINNTSKYDIPCEINIFNPNENISIKTTGGTSIDCGDILRFYNYDFDKENTIIVISINIIIIYFIYNHNIILIIIK